MGLHYDSFVLRCWRLRDEQQRIEVEHLQSGARTRVLALSAALDWIQTQCTRFPTPPPEVKTTDTSAPTDDRPLDERRAARTQPPNWSE
jgi:hypothetical protein